MSYKYLVQLFVLVGIVLQAVSCAPATTAVATQTPTEIATQEVVPTAAPIAVPTTAPTIAFTATPIPTATAAPTPVPTAPAVQAMATPTLVAQLPTKADEIQRITPEELKVLLDGGADLVVVDVQNTQEFANRHIPEAENLAWEEQLPSSRSLPTDKLLVVYGADPDGKFAEDVAMQLVTRFGYTKVMLLTGGIKQWGEDLDYPTDRSFFD